MYSQLEDGRYLHLSGVPVSEYKAKSPWRKAFNVAAGYMTLPEIYIPVVANLTVSAFSPEFRSLAWHALPINALALSLMKATICSFELETSLRSIMNPFSNTKYFDTNPVQNVTSDKDMKSAKNLRNTFAICTLLGAGLVAQSVATVGLNEAGIIITGLVSTVSMPFAFAANRYRKVVNKTWAITDTIPEQQDLPSASLQAAQRKPAPVRN